MHLAFEFPVLVARLRFEAEEVGMDLVVRAIQTGDLPCAFCHPNHHVNQQTPYIPGMNVHRTTTVIENELLMHAPCAIAADTFPHASIMGAGSICDRRLSTAATCCQVEPWLVAMNDELAVVFVHAMSARERFLR